MVKKWPANLFLIPPQKKTYTKNEVTIHPLPHLKCIRLVSVRSSLPCINAGVRIEVTNEYFFKKCQFYESYFEYRPPQSMVLNSNFPFFKTKNWLRNVTVPNIDFWEVETGGVEQPEAAGCLFNKKIPSFELFQRSRLTGLKQRVLGNGNKLGSWV